MASPPPRNRRAAAATVGNTAAGTPARATRTRTSSSRRELVMSEILEHATRLFAERGYDGTTLQDIADAIGITRPGLYNYISSKEQLLELAVSRALDQLFELTTEIAQDVRPAIDRLEALVRASVGVLVRELPYVTLLLRVRGNTDAERMALLSNMSLLGSCWLP